MFYHHHQSSVGKDIILFFIFKGKKSTNIHFLTATFTNTSIVSVP